MGRSITDVQIFLNESADLCRGIESSSKQVKNREHAPTESGTRPRHH
jgi:hypothetical protein